MATSREEFGLSARAPQHKGNWKFIAGDRVRANEKAPGDYEELEGVITGRGPGKTEYEVLFDGQAEPAHLDSDWLDLLRIG